MRCLAPPAARYCGDCALTRAMLPRTSLMAPCSAARAVLPCRLLPPSEWELPWEDADAGPPC